MPINEKRVTQALYYYAGTNSMSGFHILGQRSNMIGFTLDGIEAKEPGIQSYGGTDTQLSGAVDAFQEVKVYTTGTPAEVGHWRGGCRQWPIGPVPTSSTAPLKTNTLARLSSTARSSRRFGRPIRSTTMRCPIRQRPRAASQVQRPQ